MSQHMQKIGVVNIEELRKRSIMHLVKNIVNEQIKIIDANILSAHQLGFNQLTYSLPVTFNLSNMSNVDAQTAIYSDIIKIYSQPIGFGGRGFIVSIDIGQNEALLFIKWENGMSEEDRITRRNLIKSKQV